MVSIYSLNAGIFCTDMPITIDGGHTRWWVHPSSNWCTWDVTIPIKEVSHKELILSGIKKLEKLRIKYPRRFDIVAKLRELRIELNKCTGG